MLPTRTPQHTMHQCSRPNTLLHLTTDHSPITTHPQVQGHSQDWTKGVLISNLGFSRGPPPEPRENKLEFGHFTMTTLGLLQKSHDLSLPLLFIDKLYSVFSKIFPCFAICITIRIVNLQIQLSVSVNTVTVAHSATTVPIISFNALSTHTCTHVERVTATD